MTHYLTASNGNLATFKCVHQQDVKVTISQSTLSVKGKPVVCAADLTSNALVTCANSPTKCTKVVFIARGASRKCAINGQFRPLTSDFLAFTEYGPVTYDDGETMFVAEGAAKDPNPNGSTELVSDAPENEPVVFQARLQLNFSARKSQRYTLFLDGSETIFQGITDSEGLTEEHEIPPGCPRGYLALGHGEELSPDGLVIETQFETLPPLETLEGRWSRLRNLGFERGHPHDERGLEDALAEFAAASGLAENARLADVLNELEGRHGA